ncbi:MAG: triose-phosphate isomerase [Polyangia bacterium]|jgi:triosephosphate isomerase|nr:triose-phosphate isomerase [Polyangia bacterium]
MSRIPFICGNWKLHKTLEESVALARAVADGVAGLAGIEVGLAPVATAIHAVRRALAGSPLRVGAQNCHQEPKGAFTGELSAPLIKDAGCDFVIVGHSERRQLFGETDAGVNMKTKALLAAGLTPIVCVGETIEQRQAGQTFDLVRLQVRGALHGLGPAEIGSLVIAYEPVWAIGTGLTATTEQAQEVHGAIRALLEELAGAEADRVRIQYGGSVKPGNARALLGQPDIDGALVGGASLVADDFVAICKAAL